MFLSFVSSFRRGLESELGSRLGNGPKSGRRRRWHRQMFSALPAAGYVQHRHRPDGASTVKSHFSRYGLAKTGPRPITSESDPCEPDAELPSVEDPYDETNRPLWALTRAS